MAGRGRARHATLRDTEARNELVVQWSGLPRFVAKKYRGILRARGIDQDDAEQVGHVALLRAAEIWDESRGVRFATYAVWSIRHRVELLIRTDGLIHVPAAHAERFGGRAKRARHPGGIEDALHVAARREDEDRPEPDEMEKLRDAMRFLSARQQTVVMGRAEGRTLAEMGERVGLSKERVRQIELAAMEKLRWRMGVREAA